MTHWVIRIEKGRMYAGADQLATGPDYPSELSGTGTMPNVHYSENVNKVIESKQGSNRCVICCAGRTYPTKKSGGNKRIDLILREEILDFCDFKSYSSAEDLMKQVIARLKSEYLIDGNKNSVFLGFGFAGSDLTIVGYDSRTTSPIKASQYLNSSGEKTARAPVYPGQTAEFCIRDEISKESIARKFTVSHEQIDIATPISVSTYLSSSSSSSFSSSSSSSKSTSTTTLLSEKNDENNSNCCP